MRRALDKANPRGFPRFMKDPKPFCPVHNCEMSRRTEKAPMFEAVSSYTGRLNRTVYYCTVANCHRVQHGDTEPCGCGLQNKHKAGWLALTP